MKEKQTYQFKTEIEQLLDLLANALYTNKEIFLRELISNAADALNKIRFLSLTDSKILEDDTEFKIRIRFNEKEKTLEIEDNGVGMSEKELQESIGTIAKSGTMQFLKNLKKDQNLEQIGKFGVGFYSVFMVTDKVVVESRQYKSKTACRWTSEGKSNYTIEQIEKKTRGTKIFFTLKKEEEEFANDFRLTHIIQKYSNFVPFPIELNGEKKNQPEAIWRKPKATLKEVDYKQFFQQLSGTQGEPLLTIHYSVEAPVQFNTLLFASKEKEVNPFHPDNQELHRLHLYIKKVFIQDDCKGLVPQWMRFIYGVVDSEDLALNISREVIQSSPIVAKISQLVVKKVIAEFQKIAKSEKEKFFQLWENFGQFFKEGIYGDFENKDKLLEIYHAHSSKSPEKLVALSEIIERRKKGTKEIYYIQGKNAPIIEAHPHVEYFLKNDIEILYLYQEIDEMIMPAIGSYKEVQLVPIDKAKLDEETETSKEKNSKEKKQTTTDSEEKLLKRFKEILQDKVEDVIVSKRLIDSACTLVSSQNAMNPAMERMMQMTQKDFKKTKKILEINLKNPLIQKLEKIHSLNSKDEILKDVAEQLFDNSELIEEANEQISSMIPRINKMMLNNLDNHLKNTKK